MAVRFREAMHYLALEEKRVRCLLCPHQCVMSSGQTGICRARQNIEGGLFAINYAQTVSLALDRIEKKPLYHYYPNSKIFSLGANSCNLSCSFCQNYQISQFRAHTQELQPQELAQYIHSGSPQDMQVAFTYTEPFTWYEYIHDFARENPDIRIVLVTNGFVSEAALDQLLPYIDAMNIDLKAFTDEFYQKQCGGKLQTVLDSISTATAADLHLEITLLLIPGLNDSDSEIDELAAFIASLNPDIPLHISAYHPDFKLQIPATDKTLLLGALNIARRHLHFVYGGNMRDFSQMQSYCPACNSQIIQRDHFASISLMDGNKCSACGNQIYGRFATKN